MNDKAAHFGVWGAMAMAISLLGAGFSQDPAMTASVSIIAGLSAALLKETWDTGVLDRRLPRKLRKGKATGFDPMDILAGLTGTTLSTIACYAIL